MQHDVELEMRNGATLGIQADLNIGGKLTLKTNALLSQSGQSTISFGDNLYLASRYEISEQSQLSVGSYLYVPNNGELIISDILRA